MNFKKLCFTLTFIFWNHEVFSVPVNKGASTLLIESDSEDMLDSSVEVDLNDKNIKVYDEFTDDENIETDIIKSNFEECLNDDCFETSKYILSNMDSSVNPCEDFYQFTCGGWINTQQKKKEINYNDMRREQQKIVDKEIIELLSNDYKVNERLSKKDQEYDEKTFNNLKNIYDFCLNPPEEEMVGNDYLSEFIRKLNIYEMKGENKTDIFTNLLAKLRNTGFPLVDFEYYQNPNNFDQKFLILQLKYNREITVSSYLSHTETMPEMTIHLKEFIKNILNVVNHNEKDIEEKVETIYEIEQKFNNLKLTETLERCKDKYNDLTFFNQNEEIDEIQLDTLNKKYPFIDWKLYLKKILEFYNIENVNFDTIIICDVFADAIAIVNNIFNETDIKRLATYMEWLTLISLKNVSRDINNAFSEIEDYYYRNTDIYGGEYPNEGYYENNEYPLNIYYDEEYPSEGYYENNEYPSNIYYDEKYPSEGYNEYSSDIYGEEYPSEGYYENNENPSNIYYDEEYRNEEFNEPSSDIYNSEDDISYDKIECMKKVKQHMPMALTKYYVDHKLSENIKDKTKQIIENIKESMFDRISMIEWLDEETKQKVIEKLSKMKDIIEYPEVFNNPKIIYEKYKYIDIKDYFTYYLLTKNDNQFIYLSETEESVVDPLTVNMWYYHQLNEIDIPAAYLSLPYYGISGSDYLNYGYFGTLIGHEVTHAFDNNGRLYDSDGNKNNWWTDDDDKDFKELSQCFIDQYNDFSFSVNNKKYVIDGEITLGENIADNGGLTRGYEAWKKAILKNPEKASQHNKKLPGLSKYTLDQLFYIAYGQSRCSIRDENYVDSSTYAPGKARVNVVLSNSKDFAKAFNCPTGSPMNPKNKCSMW